MFGTFADDDIVWVNLGRSYGWWPAQLQDRERPGMNESIIRSVQFVQCEGGGLVQNSPADHSNQFFVKFFDDDNKEWLVIRDKSRIQKYSCKDKLKLIKNGFKSLDETIKGGLGGVNLRLAQFYKDVEMAEVMTDNDARVGDILAQYEVAENGDEDNVPKEKTETDSVILEEIASSSVGSRQSKKTKDVLRELNNSSLKKTKGKKRRNVK